MSGSYRLAPPSPYPFSSGSRAQQQLLGQLSGPNTNHLIGFLVGAEYQNEADRLGYQREMDEYNLTAQREGERARQEANELRREQMQHALRASVVNNPMGAAMLPPEYNLGLTPEQQQNARELLDARIARETRAGRGGGGSTVRAENPAAAARADYRLTVTRDNAVARRAQQLYNDAVAALERRNPITGMPDPSARPVITPEWQAQARAAARAQAEREVPPVPQRNAAPVATPTAPVAPVLGGAAPQAAAPPAQTEQPAAAAAAPRSQADLLAVARREGGVGQADVLRDGRIRARRADGSQFVVNPDGTTQNVATTR